MSPPSYPDISKVVREFLRKNYNFGTTFFSFKGKHDIIDFTTRIDSLIDAQKTFGTIESKLKLKDYGFTLSEKWNTRDILSADLTFEDKIVDGLTQTFRMTYDALSGRKRAFFKNKYKGTAINAQVDLALKSGLPDVSASCVIGQKDYLLGLETVWDSSQLTQANVTVAYSVDDFTFYGSISNWAKVYSAGVHQKLTDRISYAGETTWTRDLADPQWTIGVKFILDERKKQILKSKIDSQSRISCSYKSKIAKNLKIILSAEINRSAPALMGFGVQLER